ncbi:hypothetical protein [Pseudidiomarina sp.]|uniref:hypothetical protein n=1 Tax=Pseudidiomarina sp. TaxID=2081707 RepID=UPI003A987EFD
MSDWEDFCESKGWNPASEDDYDEFLESLEDDQPRQIPIKPGSDYQRFDSYTEAAAWAKANPGRVIRRAPDGCGFETKIELRNNRLPSAESAVHPPVKEDPIRATMKRYAEIKQLTPHLHDVLANSASNGSRLYMRPFYQDVWNAELSSLSHDQLLRLRLLLLALLEAKRQHLSNLYAAMSKSRKMRRGNYGEELFEVVNSIMEGVLVDIDKQLAR